MAMKRLFKIVKAFYFMNPVNCLSSSFCMIMAVLLSIFLCFQTPWMTFDFVNKGTAMEFSDLFIQIFNLINLSNIVIFSTQFFTIKKGNVTGNMNDLLLQVPVLKKDIYTIKLCFLGIIAFPFLVILIDFIVLNILISASNYLSAYVGFLALVFCIWTISLSISIGFSSLSQKKYKFAKFLPLAFSATILAFFIYMAFIPYVNPGTIVNNYNMYSGLGPMLSPLLKLCRYIGGKVGIVVILASFLLSYFFSYKLPLKISEREGN